MCTLGAEQTLNDMQGVRYVASVTTVQSKLETLGNLLGWNQNVNNK